MGRITEDLIKKRAEHNEGVLSTLEEISLHQFEIEKIENLDKYCRHLKILFLQNNIIERLENLEKMKELEYLNIGINNISTIEGLEQCESLTKLDMTLNFIDIEDLSVSMKNLSKCPKIKELYLTGNPCESWSGFKEYVIATIPQLTTLNSAEILKSERIKAIQNLPFLEKDLVRASYDNIIFKANDPDKDNPNKYTKEYRRKLYKEQEEEKLKKEEDKKKSSKPWGCEDPVATLPVYRENGEIRICNQGKYEFFLNEDIYHTGIMTFELKLPKYMDTSKIQVDLNPQYVRVVAADKATQLKFDNEIMVEKATIQRSQTTGFLLIKAPMVNIKPLTNANYKPKERPKVNKVLKPLEESLKVNQISIVEKTDSNFIKEKKNDIVNEKIDADIDLNEIPDLD